jgi:iron(III) transport system substrate-binding protein
MKRLILITLCALLLATPSHSAEVVVYTSVDQEFSEPILKFFEQQSGINVKPVYDVEAAKTVGLTNRLLAEKENPRADVFWNSEIVRTLDLQKRGVFAPYVSGNRKDIPDQYKDAEGYWTGFACRARVLIYNTTMLSADQVPRSIFDLTAPQWQGKVAMAHPVIGTAATHAGALFAQLGKEKAEQYLTALHKNRILIVSGNSIVRDVVVAGEVPLGITDTDDVEVALARKAPVDMIFPDQEGIGTFFIPNTVALINNAPHPDTAKQLIDFLLSPQVEEMLAKSESKNIPVRSSVRMPHGRSAAKPGKAMNIPYTQAADMLPVAEAFIRTLFVK